jgi:hypothetical protein
MASTSKINDNEYSEILRNADFTPASYQEIADSLMEHGIQQMYHALVNEEDNLTRFSAHALVQYQNKKTHRAFKDGLN